MMALSISSSLSGRHGLHLRQHQQHAQVLQQMPYCWTSDTRCWAEGPPRDGSVTPPAPPITTAVSCGVRIQSYSAAEALEAASGKSFGCTMCGKCCSLADDAEVWLNSNEVAAIASHLGLSTEQVAQQFLQPYQEVPDWWLLQSKQVPGPWPFEQQQLDQQQPQQQLASSSTAAGQEQRKVCVFLDESTNSCGIYQVRPLQCSTYPWWPELMPAAHWRREAQVVCEGIEHPDSPELDRWHAAQQLQLATQHTLSLEAAKPKGWDVDQELYSSSERPKG